MPCSYVIDRDRRLVVTTAWDRVTFAEAHEHQDQLLSDPSFDPEFNQLIDAAGVTSFDISGDEAARLATRAVFSAKSRRAFLATNPATFGMGRLMETYHSIAQLPEQVSVFRDRESALQWLGIEALPDEPKTGQARSAGQ